MCQQGKYKTKGTDNGGSYTDACLDCTACPTGTERGSAEDPCVRDGGGSTSDTSTCTSCTSGFYQSTDIITRKALYPANSIVDKCDACVACLPGGDRSNCAGDNAGICASWSVPIVTSVSGSGKDGGSTTGNQPLIIEGQHFGAMLTTGRPDIIVRHCLNNVLRLKYIQPLDFCFPINTCFDFFFFFCNRFATVQSPTLVCTPWTTVLR